MNLSSAMIEWSRSVRDVMQPPPGALMPGYSLADCVTGVAQRICPKADTGGGHVLTDRTACTFPDRVASSGGAKATQVAVQHAAHLGAVRAERPGGSVNRLAIAVDDFERTP